MRCDRNPAEKLPGSKSFFPFHTVFRSGSFLQTSVWCHSLLSFVLMWILWFMRTFRKKYLDEPLNSHNFFLYCLFPQLHIHSFSTWHKVQVLEFDLTFVFTASSSLAVRICQQGWGPTDALAVSHTFTDRQVTSCTDRLLHLYSGLESQISLEADCSNEITKQTFLSVNKNPSNEACARAVSLITFQPVPNRSTNPPPPLLGRPQFFIPAADFSCTRSTTEGRVITETCCCSDWMEWKPVGSRVSVTRGDELLQNPGVQRREKLPLDLYASTPAVYGALNVVQWNKSHLTWRWESKCVNVAETLKQMHFL